ncbi:MAG: hypothetical protein JKY22_00790 [Flavobacteriaceae bacterium]|nr:hypothetical protein [Flavobacteriaceae bacterium]
MELANIEKLLEAYFEGTTSEVEEQELRAFFETEEIPPHMAMYKFMFQGFDEAKEETSKQTITISEPKRSMRFWNYSIAASLLIAIGVTGYTFSQSGYTNEEEEALAAFQKTKEIMFLFSENLNEGTASIEHLNEFSNGISTMSVLNQFNESKNLILK